MVEKELEDILLTMLRGKYVVVSIGSPIESLNEVYGRPSSIEGDENGGFLHYGLLRFGYNRDRNVDWIGIYFISSPDVSIVLFFGEETFTIGSQTVLHEFIHLLNTLEIDWYASGGKVEWGIQITIAKTNALVKFDGDDGTLMSIKYAEEDMLMRG